MSDKASPPVAKAPHAYVEDSGLAVVKAAEAGTHGEILHDLSKNESHMGASPLATAAATARAADLHIYPDPASAELRAAIGVTYDINPEMIVCGNGSEEVLDAIGRVYARPGDEILFTNTGFIQFPIVAKRVGATAVRAPENNFKLDAGALLAAVTPRTKIVYVANPNNPTGTWVPTEELARLKAELPHHIVLVLDAAYADYVPGPDFGDGMELVEGTENVVVTRTFSKAWGLAALRVGWGYVPKTMVAALNPMRGIGNVNAVAQAAAVAALQDPDFVVTVRNKTAEQRTMLNSALRRLGFEPLEGVANFVTFRVNPASGVSAPSAADYLLRRGIFVRTLEDYGLGDFIRMTIGSDDVNAQVLSALEDLIAGRTNTA